MAELPASFTHELNVEAYAAIVRAFYSGPLKWVCSNINILLMLGLRTLLKHLFNIPILQEHETLLSKLRELFNFNDEMHLVGWNTVPRM